MIAFLIWLSGVVVSFVILTFLLKTNGRKITEEDIWADFFISLPSWLTLIIILIVLADDCAGRKKKND
jgi:biotin transporter BioY